jgi:hypothetical protein
MLILVPLPTITMDRNLHKISRSGHCRGNPAGLGSFRGMRTPCFNGRLRKEQRRYCHLFRLPSFTYVTKPWSSSCGDGAFRNDVEVTAAESRLLMARQNLKSECERHALPPVSVLTAVVLAVASQGINTSKHRMSRRVSVKGAGGSVICLRQRLIAGVRLPNHSGVM